MKQQINLYRPERYAAPRQTGADTLVGVVVVAVLLSAVYYGYSWWLLDGAQARLAALEAQTTDLTERRDALAEQVRAMQPSVALEVELERLSQDLEAKRAVLGMLSSDEVSNRSGFSAHLEGLARRPMRGLWLTAVSITDGGQQLGLWGKSLQADLVPRYLEALSEEAAFAGREFRTLQMTRSDESTNSIDFVLLTRSDEEQGDE